MARYDSLKRLKHAVDGNNSSMVTVLVKDIRVLLYPFTRLDSILLATTPELIPPGGNSLKNRDQP